MTATATRKATATTATRAAALVAALLLALALAACSTPVDDAADAEPVRVRAEVERADVTPGVPFELVVEIDKQRGVQFDLPDLGAEIEGLVVMDQQAEGPERAGGRELTRVVYKLKAPVTGAYLVPGVEAPWRTEDDRVGTAGTGPILIEAAHSGSEGAAGDDDLRDIKPVAAPDPLVWPWVVGGTIAAVFLVAAILAFFLLRRRKPTLEPVLLPHERARRDLNRLLQAPLPPVDAQGPFAYEVSAVLRRYLEERFGFRAWRMTTQEVLRSMPRELATRREVEAAVREVLEASDFVKFAGRPVAGEALRGWAERALDVVNATTPRPGEGEAA